MNDAAANFTAMADNSRQIETLAGMLAILAENGSMTDVQAEDTAVIIGGLATELRRLIEIARSMSAADTLA